jgi:hypothetical protein
MRNEKARTLQQRERSRRKSKKPYRTSHTCLYLGKQNKTSKEFQESPDSLMARTACLTLQRKTIKDKSLSKICSFTFVTVVLLEILVPKI